MNDTAPAIVEAAPAASAKPRLPEGTDYSLTESGQDELAQAFGLLPDEEPPTVAESDEAEESPEAAETETEEEPQETEDDADEPESEPTYTVKVDGQEVKVPLTELLKGYSRQSDYTRKTMEMAELRKNTETELQQIRAERAHAAQLLATLNQVMESQQPQEPDWDNLRQTDPIEFVMQREAWRERQEKQAAIQQQQAFIQQQMQQDQVRQLQERLKGEAEKLTAAIPEWKDAAKAKAEKQLLKDFATSMGFTPEEVGQISDHRAVVLLRKAWLFDKAMQNRKSVVQTAPKSAQPGQPVTQNKGKAAKVSELKQRLAKSGDERDFTALIHQLL